MCDRSAMFATFSSSGRIPRLIIDDWSYAWSCHHQRLEKMAISVVGNRATIGRDHRPIVVGHSLCPTTDRTINRDIQHVSVKATS